MDPGELKGRQWCEFAVPNFLPSLRAGIVLHLSQTYEMGQREIAARLGISQAAVSHYLTGRRGGGTRLRGRGDLSRYAEKLAGRIAEGLKGPRLTAAICGVCTSVRNGEGVNPCLCMYEGVSKPEFLERLGEGAGFPKQPCESMVVQRLLPRIRAETARALASDHSQQEVASLLGITQPAVSQYVAGGRGEREGTEPLPDMTRRVVGLVERLEEGLTEGDRKEALCRLCVDSRRAMASPQEA